VTEKFSKSDINDLMGASSDVEFAFVLNENGDAYEDVVEFEYDSMRWEDEDYRDDEDDEDEEDEEDEDEENFSINPPSNAGRTWTVIEDQSLIEEYVSGISLTSLASQHGRSITAIWMRLVMLSFQSEPNVAESLKRKKYELTDWTEDSKAVLRASIESGLQVATVAKVLGRSEVDIAKQIVEHGLATPKVLPKYREIRLNRRWTSAELTQLREDFRNELPIDLMAENAQRSKIAVLAMLYALEEISDDEVNRMLSEAASTAYGN
jgi:hypothetical protein